MNSAPLSWTLDPANPVIRPGRLHPGADDNRAGAGHVLCLGDIYRVYYWGTGPQGNVILMAEAPVSDPHRWQPRGGVLLRAQPDTTYNSGGPAFPFVIPLTATRWLLYFCAWGTPRPDGKLPNTTGLAVSDDAGLTWDYHGDRPVLPLDRPWDCSGTGSVCVVRVGKEFRMYYTAIGEYFPRPDGVKSGHGDQLPHIGIGYAVSRDGIAWAKPLDGLMVAPRGFDADPYEYINSKPFVCREGAGWRLWISTFGYAYRIRSLVSDDGLAWTRVPSGPDGDLGVGSAGSFDDHQRCYASVVRHGTECRMWYSANGFGNTGMGFATAPLPPAGQ